MTEKQCEITQQPFNSATCWNMSIFSIFFRFLVFVTSVKLAQNGVKYERVEKRNPSLALFSASPSKLN